MTDDELLAELARIRAALDAPPEHVVAAGRAALSTRRLDEQLARLVADSAVDDGLALVRDAQAPRLASFGSGAVTVDLQIERVGARLTVRGLAAGAAGEIVVEDADGSHPAAVDADGWFTVSDLRPGPVRVRLRAVTGTAVRTEWIAV